MSRKSVLAALLFANCSASTADGPPQVHDYGGPVLAQPVVVPIFFQNDADQPQIESFLSQLASSSYWGRATAEYGVGPLSVAPSVVITEPAPAIIRSAEIEAWLAARLDGARAQLDGVYTIFYPAETTIIDGEGNQGCQSFGGFHGEAQGAGGASIVYVAMPRCSQQGALSGLDALTAPLSHELVEASTNPLMRTNPAYAAVDVDHMVWNLMPLGEIGDMCSYDGRSYQRLVGPFVVQRVWSNASARDGHDPCVPGLGEPYFNATPVLDEALPLDYGGQAITTRGVSVPLGTSKTIEVHLFADQPVGDWAVSAGESRAKGELSFAWDKQSGNDGDTLHLTITRTADGPYLGTEMVLYAQRGAATNAWYGFVGN